MKTYLRLPAPAWFLLLVTPFVIETCITRATPLANWLNPGIALLLIFAYGPPILWLRELWVSRQLPLLSLFLFGLAYGFLNEGIVAHTITQVAGEPIAHFIGFDEWLGMHWGWMLFIVPWHALMSVVGMVLLTHLWFPAQAGQPWLKVRGRRIVAGLTILLLPLYFVFLVEGRPAPLHAFPFYLLMMGGLVWLGLRRVPAANQLPPQSGKRFALLTAAGFVAVFLFLVAGFELAKYKVPLLIYFPVLWSAVGLFIWRVRLTDASRLLTFIIGGMLSMALFSMLLLPTPVSVATFLGFLLVLVLSFRQIRKLPKLT